MFAHHIWFRFRFLCATVIVGGKRPAVPLDRRRQQRDSPPTTAAAVRDNTQPRKHNAASATALPDICILTCLVTLPSQLWFMNLATFPYSFASTTRACSSGEPMEWGSGVRTVGRTRDIKVSRYSRAADAAIVTFFVNFAL